MKTQRYITIILVLIIGILVGFILSQYFLNESINEEGQVPLPNEESNPSSDTLESDAPSDLSPSDPSPSGSEENGVLYVNENYGFKVSLPETWANYQVISEEWQADVFDDEGHAVDQVVKGPKISLRHPDYTEDQPTQDIPILVLTHDQWEAMQDTENHIATLHIGAAPIGPSELARNAKYVFALPARYNFYGYDKTDEVDEIIQSGAVQALEE